MKQHTLEKQLIYLTNAVNVIIETVEAQGEMIEMMADALEEKGIIEQDLERN